ncbi:MAG: hypothetical protein COU40_03445 [Candidatus Moranbacteria bacterium CG10_big_fil_rev_8_21_14_0_10_35_21]|nr:MAG: hypothetical protein COU40_03445 [Candidatus Moranbacteria bacterium CG10_big_fil_rev_8_21_14_0_10_35_21]PJA88367.1 MAG: hypothetical protein CO139_03570 [Candidatus Moranbacteria bacterium CG_4_9_14_3_um_filter_36_9]
MPKFNYKLYLTKETIITSLIIFASLGLFIFFPSSDSAQTLTSYLFFLFLIPVGCAKFFLNKNLKDFGFTLKINKEGIFWTIGMLIVSLLAFYILTNYTNFSSSYILPTSILNNFWLFLIYELIFFNMFFIFQEFFFKGFVLFSLREKLGWFSVLISAIIYTGLVFGTDGLALKNIPLIILAITGSVVAYKSNSVVYAYLMGILFFIIANSYFIYYLNNQL